MSPERFEPVSLKRSDPNTPGPDLPAPDIDAIANRYECVNIWFGHVCALAPPTMTLLNTSPALAALPLGALARQHPETYLLGLMTPEQLRQVGTDGLSYSDMTPDQQSLMRDLLPEPLEIVPADADPGNFQMDPADRREARAAFDRQIKKIRGDALFGALHLHAYLTTDFYVRAPAGFGIGDTRASLETTGAFKLPFSGYGNMEGRSGDTEDVLSTDVPNAPKTGDLDWNRSGMARLVSLAGIKTVDDLIARLAQATGLELYADAHYGPQALLAVGSLTKMQPAGDVMQALALCVCGTWRRVGPAYVLTDDVEGLGARQQKLAEIGQIWSNRLAQAGKDASARLQELDWLHALTFVPGDPGALTVAQIDALHQQAGGSKGVLPWSDLAPALRAQLRDHFLHYGDDLPKSLGDAELKRMADDMKAAAASVRADTPVDTTLNIRLAVELPGTGAMMLYGEYRVQTPEPGPLAGTKTAMPASPPSAPLAGPMRALLCAPTTQDEARAAVLSLTDMGLNTLMVDVFTGGKTTFANTVLPPASPDAAGVLQAALEAARPLHVPVYAVLDTLCWRKDGLAAHPVPWPVGYREDLTVTGETPDRAIQRRVEAGSLMTLYDHTRLALATEGKQGWASPLDPAVRALLPSLVQALAATPGLSGLVFQDTIPPGYRGKDFDSDGIGLGYTPENRLAYLRRTHRDPVDLSSGGDMVSVFVGGEDFFGDYPIDIPTFATGQRSYAAWTKYRAEADRSLLADCWTSAHALAPTLPVLRREGRFVSGFVPWLRPDQAENQGLPTPGRPLPSLPSGSVVTVAFGPDQQAMPERFLQTVQAASQPPLANGAASTLLGGAASNTGGVAFDLARDGTPGNLRASLRQLHIALKGTEPAPKQALP